MRAAHSLVNEDNGKYTRGLTQYGRKRHGVDRYGVSFKEKPIRTLADRIEWWSVTGANSAGSTREAESQCG